MLNPALFENSHTDGIPVPEIVSEPAPPRHPSRRFVPLKRSELRGDVLGPLAMLTLVQTFCFSRAELDKVIEALYRFPLPGDAAVRSVVVRFGEVEIVAALKEREQAEAEYDEAKQQGQQAALATRESPSVFTLHVAGLHPDEPVVIETSYVQLARPEGPSWTLRLPLTTAPRYIREDEAGSHAAQGQPLLLLRDPGHRFTLDLRVRGAHEVLSPTHALAVQPDVTAAPGDVCVTLRDGEVLPDRDCVLAWTPPQAPEHPQLQLHTFDDPASGWTYWLALVTPPAAPARQPAPRQVTLLVDHSGSMTGAKWEAADWAVVRFLNDLTERDAFALGLFHSSTAWLARDLPAGRALWVAGRVPYDAQAPLRFELHAGAEPLAAAEASVADASAPNGAAIAALFGARRVLGLEFLMQAPYAGKELEEELVRQGYRIDDLMLPNRKHLYAENARADVARALKGLLVREALAYGLASSETAFVAVRTERGERVAGTVAVANALPQGWSEQFVARDARAPFRQADAISPTRAAFGMDRLVNAAMPAFMHKERLAARPGMSADEAAPTPRHAALLSILDGVPPLVQGEALLFDSARPADAPRWRAGAHFTGIAVACAAGDPRALGARLALLIYLGDLVVPVARISLRDTLLQGGQRPLNLVSRAGQVLRIVLVDPDGVWSASAPALKITLES
jgi:hypothetical protein